MRLMAAGVVVTADDFMTSGVPVTVEAIARRPRAATFDVVVPIDLTSVFHAYGPLPAVTGVRDQTGDWDRAGVTRTVELADGSTAAEELTTVDRPDYFAYRITFDSTLGRLVHCARGEWWFESEGETTRLRWRYTFEPKRFTRPVVALAIAPLWRRYAERGIARVIAEVERAVPAATS